MKRPLLGAHVSAARLASSGHAGIVSAIERGEALGAECIQIFGASPRTYAAPLPSVETASAFKSRLKASSITSVFQHGAYLPNLGASDPVAIKKGIVNLTAHYQIAHMIGSVGVIFHVGSPNGGNREEGLLRAAAAMKEVLKSKSDAYLVMENSGSIKKIGGSLAELDWLRKKVGDSRVKICIDTAHAFESGLIERYDAAGVKAFVDQIDEVVGLEHLVALHANDSKTAYNSQHDRHENMGEGFIGLAGFRALGKEKRIAHTAWFLEVPGFDGNGPDKKNMDLLKSCFI
jgi:deoxyribonuclease IV